ncbi:MAG: Bug family tripartite tricarboxylate transporter substrate binding protein [Xanthobacteraceae bacterium]|jgi:tripartite-type tricarboxylate transporter receptor subunit TctC
MTCAPNYCRTLLLASVLAIGAMTPAAADYYAGKTIEFIIGTPPGGGYDIYARLVARHLARYIPGKPTIVVKNMPGAGSAKAAQFISMIAPKDGTSIGAIMPGAIMGPLLDDRADALFDPTKVLYVGTANSGTRVCVALKGTKIRTFDDLLREKAVFGGVSTNDSTQEYGYLHKRTSGARYDVVSGYRGTPDIALALERGELDGVCGWDWSSVKSQRPDWIRDDKINVLLQVSLDPHPELTRMGVPSVWQYVKSEEDRKVVELVISQTVFHRSYIAPPGTPAAALETLRTAFDATMNDKELLDEAEKLRIDIAPLPGANVQALVEKLYATPKEIVAKAKQAIKP